MDGQGFFTLQTWNRHRRVADKLQAVSGIPQIDFFKGRLEIFHGIGEEMLSRCTFQALITYF